MPSSNYSQFVVIVTHWTTHDHVGQWPSCCFTSVFDSLQIFCNRFLRLPAGVLVLNLTFYGSWISKKSTYKRNTGNLVATLLKKNRNCKKKKIEIRNFYPFTKRICNATRAPVIPSSLFSYLIVVLSHRTTHPRRGPRPGSATLTVESGLWRHVFGLRVRHAFPWIWTGFSDPPRSM